MSVDYRLLHHFRVSQRREMASRGELSVLRTDEEAAGESGAERRSSGDASVAPAPLTETRRAKAPPANARPGKTSALPAKAPAKAQRAQVLTHLLNEDR